MSEYVVGRSSRSRYDHMVKLEPGVIAGTTTAARCGRVVTVLNNGDALYAWDPKDSGEHACPKCRPEVPSIVAFALEGLSERSARPYEPPHQPRP